MQNEHARCHTRTLIDVENFGSFLSLNYSKALRSTATARTILLYPNSKANQTDFIFLPCLGMKFELSILPKLVSGGLRLSLWIYIRFVVTKYHDYYQ